MEMLMLLAGNDTVPISRGWYRRCVLYRVPYSSVQFYHTAARPQKPHKLTAELHQFLPRDSYAKRGICRRRVSVCLCVCVCLSHSGIVSKRLNIGPRKQRRTIAP